MRLRCCPRAGKPLTPNAIVNNTALERWLLFLADFSRVRALRLVGSSPLHLPNAVSTLAPDGRFEVLPELRTLYLSNCKCDSAMLDCIKDRHKAGFPIRRVFLESSETEQSALQDLRQVVPDGVEAISE